MCKENVLIVCGSGFIKIVLTLLTKIIAIYLQAFIAKFESLGLENSIPRGEVCLAMFLVFNK